MLALPQQCLLSCCYSCSLWLVFAHPMHRRSTPLLLHFAQPDRRSSPSPMAQDPLPTGHSHAKEGPTLSRYPGRGCGDVTAP